MALFNNQEEKSFLIQNLSILQKKVRDLMGRES